MHLKRLILVSILFLTKIDILYSSCPSVIFALDTMVIFHWLYLVEPNIVQINVVTLSCFYGSVADYIWNPVITSQLCDQILGFALSRQPRRHRA